jgi:hypothetical protein
MSLGGNQHQDEFDDEDSDGEEAKNLHLSPLKTEMDDGGSGWTSGR